MTTPSHRQSLGLSLTFSDPLVKTDRSNLVQSLRKINAYAQESRLIGGYYSADIQFTASEETINDWTQSGINRHIETTNPNLVKIWEGFVNQIEVVFGENTYSIGPLVDIGNKVRVDYSAIDYSVYPPTFGIQTYTDYASNATSQGLYGIWEKIQSISGATDTEAQQIRDTYVNDPLLAFPPVSSRLTLEGSNQPTITLKCLGYWHYLKAYYYTNNATGQIDISQQIQDVLAADVNSVFSTDYSKITSNMVQVTDGIAQEVIAEGLMKRLNSIGDASDNAYAIGFYNDRVLYYEVLPTTVAYQKRRGKRITDNLGGIIQPWDVKPARWLFQPDMLVGRHPPITAETLGNDPRAILIDTVKYSTPYGLNITGKKFSQLDQMLAKNGLGTV